MPGESAAREGADFFFGIFFAGALFQRFLFLQGGEKGTGKMRKPGPRPSSSLQSREKKKAFPLFDQTLPTMARRTFAFSVFLGALCSQSRVGVHPLVAFESKLEARARASARARERARGDDSLCDRPPFFAVAALGRASPERSLSLSLSLSLSPPSRLGSALLAPGPAGSLM